MRLLYLVAVLPPEPILSQIWALKQEVHSLTSSRNAVRLPPHITLLPPWPAPAEAEATYSTALAAFAATEVSCPVTLKNFAWFGDRTLYVHVSQAAALQAMQARLAAWCEAQSLGIPAEKRPYTPHLTLATRDLPSA
jgi:2'-5' RNA ligase